MREGSREKLAELGRADRSLSEALETLRTMQAAELESDPLIFKLGELAKQKIRRARERIRDMQELEKTRGRA